MSAHKTLKVEGFPKLEETFGIELSGISAVAETLGDGKLELSPHVYIVIRGEIIETADKLKQDLEIIAVAYNGNGDVVGAELETAAGGHYSVEAASFIGIEPFQIEIPHVSVVDGLPVRVRVYPRPAEWA